MRALFAVAKVEQPSVIFIDEIDSILCQRTSEENECTRRIKTEFLVQLDGTGTGENDRILVVGATNRPQELDEAARRRLTKRLYIPLPDLEARKQIVENLMSQTKSILSPEEIDHIAKESEGFSGADMANLCKEASMGPIRTLSTTQREYCIFLFFYFCQIPSQRNNLFDLIIYTYSFSRFSGVHRPRGRW